MLNSTAHPSKIARAPAGAPCREKSSRGKGLMQGRRARYRRAYETSRNMFEWRAVALSLRSQTHDCTMPSRSTLLWSGERRLGTAQIRTTADSDATTSLPGAAPLLAETVSRVLCLLSCPRPSCTCDRKRAKRVMEAVDKQTVDRSHIVRIG